MQALSHSALQLGQLPRAYAGQKASDQLGQTGGQGSQRYRHSTSLQDNRAQAQDHKDRQAHLPLQEAGERRRPEADHVRARVPADRSLDSASASLHVGLRTKSRSPRQKLPLPALRSGALRDRSVQGAIAGAGQERGKVH